ncbi:MAG TPA: MFS transporter [Candidatus Limnocylindrales bacterium]|nr:MFS transporter [Candidatus Limnocylindrales bacterium]
MSPDPGAALALSGTGQPVHPERTLWLLSAAHAVNHAQAVILPLIFLKIIKEFGVGAETVAFLAAAAAVSAGFVQASFAFITRRLSRRLLMGIGGLLFGLGFAAQGAAPSFGAFALTNIVSRIGGSPQHPVGNGLLAEQFPPERRGFAISAHISGGNVGTVIVAIAGAWLLANFGWRGVSLIFGIPAALVALAILRWVRESGADRAAAIAEGSVRDAMRVIWRDPTIRRVYLASVLGGGGRGLGVANLFAVLYLTHVLGLPDETTNLMYGGLIVLSVPMPLVAGWLSDRIGRRPVILGAYIGGALGFVAFIAVGSSLLGLWVGLAIMGLFSFAESPQLQALLADVAPAPIRDVTFALYFTLAFGVGSLWVALYGAIISPSGLGEAAGLPIVFGLMAASFVAAAVVMLPVRDPPREPNRRAMEAAESV